MYAATVQYHADMASWSLFSLHATFRIQSGDGDGDAVEWVAILDDSQEQRDVLVLLSTVARAD